MKQNGDKAMKKALEHSLHFFVAFVYNRTFVKFHLLNLAEPTYNFEISSPEPCRAYLTQDNKKRLPIKAASCISPIEYKIILLYNQLN